MFNAIAAYTGKFLTMLLKYKGVNIFKFWGIAGARKARYLVAEIQAGLKCLFA